MEAQAGSADLVAGGRGADDGKRRRAQEPRQQLARRRPRRHGADSATADSRLKMFERKCSKKSGSTGCARALLHAVSRGAYVLRSRGRQHRAYASVSSGVAPTLPPISSLVTSRPLLSAATFMMAIKPPVAFAAWIAAVLPELKPPVGKARARERAKGRRGGRSA